MHGLCSIKLKLRLKEKLVKTVKKGYHQVSNNQKEDHKKVWQFRVRFALFLHGVVGSHDALREKI